MNNTTYMAKKNEVESKWYIIDASQKPLGRVAAEAAKLLRGKHKPTFTPNQDTGDHVIILNCKDIILPPKFQVFVLGFHDQHLHIFLLC